MIIGGDLVSYMGRSSQTLSKDNIDDRLCRLPGWEQPPPMPSTDAKCNCTSQEEQCCNSDARAHAAQTAGGSAGVIIEMSGCLSCCTSGNTAQC